MPAKSTIAHAYIKYLKKQAKSNDGYITLPGPLNFFVGTDGKCEHAVKVTSPLLLQWTKELGQKGEDENEAEEEVEDEDGGFDFL